MLVPVLPLYERKRGMFMLVIGICIFAYTKYLLFTLISCVSVKNRVVTTDGPYGVKEFAVCLTLYLNKAGGSINLGEIIIILFWVIFRFY